MRRLFVDALGFAGCKMTRRILGLAHVEDLEGIANPDLRAECEKRALKLARTLMVEGAGLHRHQGGERRGTRLAARDSEVRR